MQSLAPLAPVPAVSISADISALAARDESEITAAVAAVELLLSLASMVIVVERIEALAVAPSASGSSFISKAGRPDVEAVLSEALTAVTVKAYGICQVTFAVPVVIAVVSSDKAKQKLSVLFVTSVVVANVPDVGNVTFVVPVVVSVKLCA